MKHAVIEQVEALILHAQQEAARTGWRQKVYGVRYRNRRTNATGWYYEVGSLGFPVIR
jgi:hypothetical protein